MNMRISILRPHHSESTLLKKGGGYIYTYKYMYMYIYMYIYVCMISKQ